MRLELKNVVKYFQDRCILKIKDLRIYHQEVVGIVGLNGSGKTTLLNIMAGQLKPDEGTVKIYGDYSYITQFAITAKQVAEIDRGVARKFKIPATDTEFMSGGEKTRFKIAVGLSKSSAIIFADEPTANLDLEGIKLFEEAIKQFPGTVVIVSHDRELLDKLCNKILEIEDGQLKEYNGNYSGYLEQKERERQRQQFEYEQFVKEKSRLKTALVEMQQKSRSVRKTPKRMGNSEARLHKMGNQRAKANIDKAVEATKSRIELLQTKEKPKDLASVKLELNSEEIHSKILIQGENLDITFGQKTIFAKACFQIRKGEKTALMGDNGSGKTTLLKMIMKAHQGIKNTKNLKIGYFSQSMDLLDESKTIIEDLMESSIHDEALTRTVLAQLLFKGDDIYKKISVLSGGERVRAALGKIVLSDFNMLILDEPTNYLDIYSLEAVEQVLAEYGGNLLFVSHDRKFVNKIATNILLIENQGIIPFQGNYEQYLAWSVEQNKDPGQERRMLLEYRLSEIIGRLAAPSKKDDVKLLDQEYKSILSQLRELVK